MIRIALGIEYDGTHYNGWQRQGDLPTVQSSLELAISKIANHTVNISCAGRTDRSVHATGQVVHFEYNNTIPRNINAWTMGVNSMLPDDISVSWAQVVPDDFHARFSALSRRYQYYIYVSPSQRALLNNKAVWVYRDLNIAAMQKACDYLLGEQDFSSFRSSECQSTTPMRNVIAAEIKIIKGFIVLDIKANAFLHHMVRNIVGCLLEIGLNKKPGDWMLEVIKLRDRTQAAKTAGPEGLYLLEVEYDKKFEINHAVRLPFEG